MKNIFTILFMLPVVLLGQKARTINALKSDSISQKTEKINSIFSSDSIHIIATSNGCFHSQAYYYKVIKKTGFYEVTNLDSFEAKHKLKSKGFSSLHKLCIHGLHIDLGLCTTREDFRITDGKKTVHFFDGRCSDEDDILTHLLKILN